VLDTLVLEARSIGGQAGTSSMIRNYLGFHRGISGGELAHRAWQQAVLLGARSSSPIGLPALPKTVTGTGSRSRTAARWPGRAVVLAAGVSYRHLDIPELDRLIGAGVYYGAAGVMAPAVAGEDVYVVGGANSAGQAALHLAKYAARVTPRTRHLPRRRDVGLPRPPDTGHAERRRRLGTRVVGGRGQTRLEGLILEDEEARQEEAPAAAVFILIGAKPHTDWLAPALALVRDGFVLTGRDVPRHGLAAGAGAVPLREQLPGSLCSGRYSPRLRQAGCRCSRRRIGSSRIGS
jgi:thioredoxin reductase (NADPH)